MRNKMRFIIFVVCFLMMAPIVLLTGCNYEIDYKTTSDKLSSAIAAIKSSKCFSVGGIEVDLFPGSSTRDLAVSYDTEFKPKLNFGTENVESFKEVNDYYSTVFAFSMNYISQNMLILSTKPRLKTLNERQEDLYEALNRTIDAFKGSIPNFERDVEKINQYYANKETYGTSSEEVYFLNFKKAYRDFIHKALDLSYAIENLTAEVYTEFDFKEYKFKEGTTFKSLEDGINAKVFEGYFEFLVDTFECRVPTLIIDANETMQDVVSSYQVIQTDFKELFGQYVAHASLSARAQIEAFLNDASLDLTTEERSYLEGLKDSYGLKANMTKDEIADARSVAEVYFQEMELYEKAYERIGFEKFYFDDDCDLDGYMAKDTANVNRFNKIKDYLLNVLPRFNDYIFTTFF